MADWLWDGSGEPDDTERRLSEALRPLAVEPECPPLPERPSLPERPRRRSIPAILAVFAMAAGLLFALRGPRDWPVRATTGPCASGDCALGEGGRLSTGPGESLDIEMNGKGHLALAEGSNLSREPDDEGHLLRLERGGLELSWTGPPRGVRVETPAASVIDLGCAYSLFVDDEGTDLSVVDGTILLKNALGESYVAGGSGARARPGEPPALPLRFDAEPGFAAAMEALNRGERAALPEALELARPEDLLTLWNLLARVPEAERPAVYAAIRRHVASLPETPSPALLALDGPARSALWQAIAPVALR